MPFVKNSKKNKKRNNRKRKRVSKSVNKGPNKRRRITRRKSNYKKTNKISGGAGAVAPQFAPGKRLTKNQLTKLWKGRTEVYQKQFPARPKEERLSMNKKGKSNYWEPPQKNNIRVERPIRSFKPSYGASHVPFISPHSALRNYGSTVKSIKKPWNDKSIFN